MAEVRVIYLPSGEGGVKQGVDDYLVAGNTIDDLFSLAVGELRSPPEEQEERPDVPYRETPNGLVWDRQTRDGLVVTPLTNFTARIVCDLEQDDGAEVERSFEIQADLGGQRRRFSVPAQKFAPMSWTTEQLGAGAIVYPGFTNKDHARAAIQMLSGDIEHKKIFAHTGWREIEGAWFYLHGDGAIGDHTIVGEHEVSLGANLSMYTLTEPVQDDTLAADIRESLGLLELAPENISFPLLCSVYRAVLGKTDFAVHLAGPTGTGKSELAALFQQHFGPTLDSRNLTSWESTENALESKAFALKDFVMVVDDFAPGGTSNDVQRLHRKADRLIRGKGNASGRERLRSDLALRAPKPPRALVLSTGEDIPRGQSLRARMLILELGPQDLRWERLTRYQEVAREAAYARAIAGFARWLSRDYGSLSSNLVGEAQALREKASRESQHNRTPHIIAELAVGLRHFLMFAVEAGAFTQQETEELRERGWVALLEAAAVQAIHQSASEPATRFLELLRAAVASGRAHIVAADGEKPTQSAQALGWQKVSAGGDYEEWQPRGDKVGWVKGDDLYLEPDAAYRVAQEQARGGEGLAITERTLRKRLNEKNYLAGTDKRRETLTVRRTIEGVSNRDVLHLRRGTLFNHAEELDIPDVSDSEGGGESGERQQEATSLAAGADTHQSSEASDRRVRQISKEDGGNDDQPRADALSETRGTSQFELVETPEQIEALSAKLKDADRIALDLETTGLNPRTDRVRLMSVAVADRVWLVDCSKVAPAYLLPVLAEKTLVFHNAAFDLGFLYQLGFEPGEGGRILDTMLMSRIVGDSRSDLSEKRKAA